MTTFVAKELKDVYLLYEPFEDEEQRSIINISTIAVLAAEQQKPAASHLIGIFTSEELAHMARERYKRSWIEMWPLDEIPPA